MDCIFYPQHLNPNEEGSVKEFIRKDLKKYNDLRLLVQKFLDRVYASGSLQPFFNDETISPLSYCGIFEMKIPKTRKGGVVRIYFCYHCKIDKLLVLLDAELKHEKVPGKIDRAIERMKIFVSDVKVEKNNEKK